MFIMVENLSEALIKKLFQKFKLPAQSAAICEVQFSAEPPGSSQRAVFRGGSMNMVLRGFEEKPTWSASETI